MSLIPVTGTPIAMPSGTGLVYPETADLKQFDAIAENISPFTGSAEQQQFQDQHWELDLEWPPMTWSQFAPWQGFLASLHGKLNPFLWGPPLATAPRGLGNLGGGPFVSVAPAAGANILNTAGWLPNSGPLLLPGDFLQLTGAPDSNGIYWTRLYQYCGFSGLGSDGGGNATITIFPGIREVPAVGTVLVFNGAQGSFRLADNRRSAPAKKNKTFTFSMKCREAI
jgi:hypothetical protein